MTLKSIKYVEDEEYDIFLSLPRMDNIKLGIVLLNFNNDKYLNQCIEKILAWKSINYTIYLINIESKNSIISHKRVVCIEAKENLGFGGNNNIGIKQSIASKNDFTLLLNNDAIIDEKSVIQLLELAVGINNVFSFGPLIQENRNGNPHYLIGGKNIAKYSNTRTETTDLNNLEKIVDVFYNVGAIIFLNNDALKKVGFFDESYFFSGEVADLCYRAKNLGFKSLTFTSFIGIHNPENTKKRQTLYKYYSIRNRFLFIRKHNFKKKYIKKWYSIIFKELFHFTRTMNYVQIRTLLITLSHVLFRVNGNQNNKFL